MLNVQYRMVPLLSKFPSKQFYENLLQNGENVLQKDYVPKNVKNFVDEI